MMGVYNIESFKGPLQHSRPRNKANQDKCSSQQHNANVSAPDFMESSSVV